MPINEEFTERLRKDLYSKHPDFGNYGKGEKQEAIGQTLTDYNKMFVDFPNEERSRFIDERLHDLGEESTYGVGEFAWDVGVPTVAAAVGQVGGAPGTVLGGMVGAGFAESEKADYERRKRGISQQTPEEKWQMGQMPMVLEAGGLIAAPLLSAISLGLKRKIFNPEGLTEGTRIAQRKLSQLDVRRGITHPFTPLGETLSLGQLNSAEGSLWQQIESLAGGGSFGRRKLMKHYEKSYKLLHNDLNNLFNLMGTHMDDVQYGDMVKKMLDGDIDFVKMMRTDFWKTARDTIEHDTSKVNIGPLIDHFAKEVGEKGRSDAFQVMRGINDFLGLKNIYKGPIEDVERAAYLTPIGDIKAAPREVTVKQAQALVHRLNEMVPNKKAGKAAGKASEITKKAFMDTLKKGNPEAHKAYTKAFEYHAQTAERLFKGNMPTIMKQLTTKPEALSKALKGGNEYSKLMAIKKAITTGKPRETALSMVDYKDKILKPLIFDICRESYDSGAKVLSGDMLMASLKKHGAIFTPDFTKPGPYLEEVMGKELFDQTLDFAQALQKAGKSAAGQGIFIRFMEAGVIIGAVSGAASQIPGFGQRAAGVFLAPVALANMLTSRRLLRTLTDGIQSPAGSTAGGRLVMTVAAENERANKTVQNMTGNAMNYYYSLIPKPAPPSYGQIPPAAQGIVQPRQ